MRVGVLLLLLLGSGARDRAHGLGRRRPSGRRRRRCGLCGRRRLPPRALRHALIALSLLLLLPSRRIAALPAPVSRAVPVVLVVAAGPVVTPPVTVTVAVTVAVAAAWRLVWRRAVLR